MFPPRRREPETEPEPKKKRSDLDDALFVVFLLILASAALGAFTWLR